MPAEEPRPRAKSNRVVVTMRRRSTVHMEIVGGGFLGELSESQEEALRLVRNAVDAEHYPELDLSPEQRTFKLDDRMLLRFLRAQNFKVSKAIEQVKDHIRFRNQWRPHEIKATDPDIAAFIDAGIWEIVAETNDGHPVEVLRFRCYHPAAFTPEAFTRAVIYHRERVLERLSNPAKDTVYHQEEFVLRERSLIIFDAHGWKVGYQGTAAGMRQIRTLIDILTRQYCETLGVGAIIFAPAVFRWVWALIKPWMDSETANRIVFGEC